MNITRIIFIFVRSFISNESFFRVYFLSFDDGSRRNPPCIKTSIKVLEASPLKSLFYGHPRVSKIIPRNLSGSGFVDFHFRTGSHPKLGELEPSKKWLFKSFFFFFQGKLNQIVYLKIKRAFCLVIR